MAEREKHPDRSRPGTHPDRHFPARQRPVERRGQAGGVQSMYLGIDVGTSSVKAVLIDGDQRIVASRQRRPRSLAPAPRLVGAGPGKLVAGDRGRARRARRRPRARNWPRSRASAFPATCTARPCSTPPTSRSARASCGTTAAPPRRPRSSSAAELSAITGNIAMPGFTAPKLVWVASARAGDLRQGRGRCFCPRTTSA